MGPEALSSQATNDRYSTTNIHVSAGNRPRVSPTSFGQFTQEGRRPYRVCSFKAAYLDPIGNFQ